MWKGKIVVRRNQIKTNNTSAQQFFLFPYKQV